MVDDKLTVLYSMSGRNERRYTFTGVVCCSVRDVVEEHLDDSLPVAREEKLKVEWRLMVSGEAKFLRVMPPLRDMVSDRASSFRDMVSGDTRSLLPLRVSSGEEGRSPFRLMVSGLTLEPRQLRSEDARPKDEVDRYVTCFNIVVISFHSITLLINTHTHARLAVSKKKEVVAWALHPHDRFHCSSISFTVGPQ